MFSYLAVSHWDTKDEKQVATIEELLKLCKSGEVERVIIPMTGYYYGASLLDMSNSRSIQRRYPRAKFKDVQGNLTMSPSQFIRNEHYREMIEELQEQYPIFDETDYSMLESETKLEFLVDEVSYILINDEESEVFALLPDTLSETKAVVTDVLESRGNDYSHHIEWWEYVEIDNDGTTPYAQKDQLAELAVLVSVAILEAQGEQ